MIGHPAKPWAILDTNINTALQGTLAVDVQVVFAIGLIHVGVRPPD